MSYVVPYSSHWVPSIDVQYTINLDTLYHVAFPSVIIIHLCKGSTIVNYPNLDYLCSSYKYIQPDEKKIIVRVKRIIPERTLRVIIG